MVTAGEPVRLDEGALCIAAHARPDLDVDAWCTRLDDLAAACSEASFDGVRHELFTVCGFRGDVERYSDPQNSLLDAVLERRRGIPITLSVVMIEVARRLGVGVEGIGMPGHFIVRPSDREHVWCDPFNGGVLLRYDDCARLFDGIYRGTRALQPDDLAPVSGLAILARVLANLEHGPLGRDPQHLAWMCELHLAIPGVAFGDQLQLLRRLAGVADYQTVIAAYERVAAGLDDDLAAQVQAEGDRLRARWN
jgi:regulator of sirC expression with transglutaminase-like and TPR domain